MSALALDGYPQGSGGSISAIAPIAGSPYQQAATRIGNFTDDTNPFGQVGKGSPPFAFAPLVIDQTFGRSTPGANILKTTQAVMAYARYYGPATEDSQECISGIANLVDTGTPFTTAQPLVGVEGIAIIQGGNISTSNVIGTIGNAQVANTATATNGMAFYVSPASGATAAGATLTNFYGLYQPAITKTGTVTNLWGAWLNDRLQVVGVGSAFGTAATSGLPSSTLYVQGLSGNTAADLVIQQGTSQTTPQIVLRTSGAATRLQMFGASGNILLGNGAGGAGGVGIISMVTTTNPSGSGTGGKIYVDTGTGVLSFLDAAGVSHVLY